MATFNEFCEKVKLGLKKGFKKVSVEVEKAADTASLHIKLNTLKTKISEHYEELGQLTFAQIRGEGTEDTESRVETLVAMIAGKQAEQKAIREELERRKAEKEAAKAAEKTEYEAEAEAPTEEASEAPAEITDESAE